ncbi:MAG: hypothetical protein OEV40_10150 [Acidimicrobiia bacterium]|nr:hypothetical protein [Acidimicrobiia bacterium]
MSGPEPLIGRWETVGRVAKGDASIGWLGDATGSACIGPGAPESTTVEVLVTGRDSLNRSLIGRGTLDLASETPRICFEPEPALGLGSLGAFDENGVSYPCAVDAGDSTRLYYTGWMPSVLTPFQNHLGAAKLAPDRTFERISRAPILERTDADYLSLGSCFVLREAGRWLMWYTSWLAWGERPEEPKHTYVIKTATSCDGLTWERPDVVCIDVERRGEHSICRPSVIVNDGGYHMWYCTRGDAYRLGYAVSADGVHWTRCDHLLEIGPLDDWDSGEQCYPHVFERAGELWMLYCGNGYGRGGLGLARFVGRA